MKSFKKIIIAVLLFVFMAATTEIPVISHTITANAATAIKISDKTLTLNVGETKLLKIKGSKKDITWTSNKKSVASVSKKGKVTAVKEGTAKITASVAGKKLTCTVTVVSPNPYLEDAPFDAMEKTIANFNFVMPSEWTLTTGDPSPAGIEAVLTPNDTSLSSEISIAICPKDYTIYDYESLKAEVSSYTEEYISTSFKTQFETTELEITDYQQSELEASCGNVMKTQFTLTVFDMQMKICIYTFLLGDFYINITSFDMDNLDLTTMTEYVIKSLIIK